MSVARCLIVNADDFGRSPGVNRGIIGTFERGIVTSASLMVRWPDAAAAAAYGRGHPDLSVGLHVDLGEWSCRDGTWMAVYEVVPLSDSRVVAEEVARQLAVFRNLLGRDPTHLDSHQHVHREEPVRSVLSALACQLRVPLRDCHPAVRYCGDFYGQTGKGQSCPAAISVEGLLRIISALPAGVTELGCHPGEVDNMDSMYRNERAQEVKTLCHPQIRSALVAEGIELRSFRNRPLTKTTG
jgi:chitin disaccharide deacetylase